MDVRSEYEFLESTSTMIGVMSVMNASDRSYLNFEIEARKAFDFVRDLGFSEIEASPTLLRYRKGDVDLDVYHGRKSYEIGAGVTAFGVRYAISEIIRHKDPELARQYRYAVATTPDGVISGLSELSALMSQHGRPALDGDPRFFLMLENGRKSWCEEYALDVLADQIRPQAEDAFRARNYTKAAELYSQIKERLSSTEIQKLRIAEERKD